jgi:3-oxoacyl-[acyl-carrier protein] reductase
VDAVPGRWGSPDDVAAIVRLIVDEDSRQLTGQVIDAEGGYRRSSLD